MTNLNKEEPGHPVMTQSLINNNKIKTLAVFLALVFASLFIGITDAMAQSFPYLGAYQETKLITFQGIGQAYQLFNMIAGLSDIKGLYYLTLTAALIGFVLIVMIPSNRELGTIGAWLFLVLVLLVHPLKSQLLFYQLNPINIPNEGGEQRQVSVYAYMPQLVPIHVMSVLAHVLDGAFFQCDNNGVCRVRDFITSQISSMGLMDNNAAKFSENSPVPMWVNMYEALNCGSGQEILSPSKTLAAQGASNRVLDKAKMFTVADALKVQSVMHREEKYRRLPVDSNVANLLSWGNNYRVVAPVAIEYESVAKLQDKINTIYSSLGMTVDAQFVKDKVGKLLKGKGVLMQATGGAPQVIDATTNKSFAPVKISTPNTLGYYIASKASTESNLIEIDERAKATASTDAEGMLKAMNALPDGLGKALTQGDLAQMPAGIYLGYGSGFVGVADTSYKIVHSCSELHDLVYQQGLRDVFANVGLTQGTANTLLNAAVGNSSGVISPADFGNTWMSIVTNGSEQSAARAAYVKMYQEEYDNDKSAGKSAAARNFYARVMANAMFKSGALVNSITGTQGASLDLSSGARMDNATGMGAFAGTTGMLAKAFGQAATWWEGLWAGGKISAYMMFLMVLTNMALLAILAFTPLIYIFGLLIPSNAPGVIIISVLSVAVIKAIPCTFIVINVLATIIAKIMKDINSGIFTESLVMIVAATLYTSI
ncbi:MAG: hypothetical protein WAX89_01175, partial [Alphaproteobacteria bacterium]